MGLRSRVAAGFGGASVRAIPFADGSRSAFCCLRDEVGREVRGGFVLASEAWAGSRIGAAVYGLFGAAFALCDGG